MQILKFKAENWVNDEVEVHVKSETEFTVQGYDFRIGEVRADNDDEDYQFEWTNVYSLAHSETEPFFVVNRDLKPNKWSDSLYHAQEGDFSRSGKSVHEVVAKLVAMCF